MKVFLINGSPHKNGCTNEALTEIKELGRCDVDSEIFWIGTKPVRGCIACGKCVDDGFCAFDDDPANEMIQKILDSDAVIIGSPVYFAGPNGALCALWTGCFIKTVEGFHTSLEQL